MCGLHYQVLTQQKGDKTMSNTNIAPSAASVESPSNIIDRAAERIKNGAPVMGEDTQRAPEMPTMIGWGLNSTGNPEGDALVKSITEGLNTFFVHQAKGNTNCVYAREKVTSTLVHQEADVSYYKIVWAGMALGVAYVNRMVEVGNLGGLGTVRDNGGYGDYYRRNLSVGTLAERVMQTIAPRIAATEPTSTKLIGVHLLSPYALANHAKLVGMYACALNSKLVAFNEEFPVTAASLLGVLNATVGSNSGILETSSSIMGPIGRVDGLGHIPGIEVTLSYRGDNRKSVDIMRVAVKPTFHTVRVPQMGNINGRPTQGILNFPVMVITDIIDCNMLPAPELYHLAIGAVHEELVIARNWVNAYANDKEAQIAMCNLVDVKPPTKLLDGEELRALVDAAFQGTIVAVDEVIGSVQIAGADGLVPTRAGSACYMAHRAAKFFSRDFNGLAAYATDVDEHGTGSRSSISFYAGIDKKNNIDSRQYGAIELLKQFPEKQDLILDISTAQAVSEVDMAQNYADLASMQENLPDTAQYLIRRHFLSDAFVGRLSECLSEAFRWARSGQVRCDRGIIRRVNETPSFIDNRYSFGGGSAYDYMFNH
jgi:hypothetical protein